MIPLYAIPRAAEEQKKAAITSFGVALIAPSPLTSLCFCTSPENRAGRLREKNPAAIPTAPKRRWADLHPKREPKKATISGATAMLKLPAIP